MNKFAVASLLGAASAAMGPLPSTNYPQYASLYTLTSTDQDGTTKMIKSAFMKDSGGSNNIGTIRAFRNSLIVFFTQNVQKYAAATTRVLAAQTTTSTWWQIKSTQLGTFPTTSTVVGDDASGPTYVACESGQTSTTVNCNGAVTADRSGTVAYNQFVARIFAKSDKQNEASPGYSFQIGGVNADKTYTWNTDFLAAAQYQSDWTTAGTLVDSGAEWCSGIYTKFADNTTSKELVATNGFTGRTKCTWQILAKDGTTAPAINLSTNAEYSKFYVQFVDWVIAAALGNDNQLPTTDAADFHMGPYDTTKVFPFNPVKTKSAGTGWAVWGASPAYTQSDPKSYGTGSLGTAKYYNTAQSDGPFATAGFEVDAVVIQNEVMAGKQTNTDYDNLKNAYNSKAKIYNDAVTAEETRMKDFFKSIFDPKVAIPDQPEPPTKPAAYPNMYIAAGASTDGLNADATLQKGSVMKTGAAKSAGVNTDSYRQGYLYSTADDSKTGAAADAKAITHTFGRLGQGDATDPSQGAKAWYYGAQASNNAPGMMISYLPFAENDNGINASGKKLVTTARPVSFMGLGDYAAPGGVSGVDSLKSTGATALTMGIATAAVALSLF